MLKKCVCACVRSCVQECILFFGFYIRFHFYNRYPILALCSEGYGPNTCNKNNEGEAKYKDGNVVTNSGGTCYAPSRCSNCNKGFYPVTYDNGYCKGNTFKTAVRKLSRNWFNEYSSDSSLVACELLMTTITLADYLSKLYLFECLCLYQNKIWAAFLMFFLKVIISLSQ
jgi:hypothetical protein